MTTKHKENVTKRRPSSSSSDSFFDSVWVSACEITNTTTESDHHLDLEGPAATIAANGNDSICQSVDVEYGENLSTNIDDDNNER